MFNPLSRLEKAFRRQPQEPLFARLADSYLNKGQIDKAVQLCLEGCERFPDYSTGFQVLSKCHQRQGDYEAARAALDKALRLDPDNPSGYVQLSQIYRELGNTVLALKSLQQAANFDPLSLSLAREIDQLSYQVGPGAPGVIRYGAPDNAGPTADAAADALPTQENEPVDIDLEEEWDNDWDEEAEQDEMAQTLGLGDDGAEEDGLEPPSLSQEELDVLLGGDTDSEADDDGLLEDEDTEADEAEVEEELAPRQEYQELASLGAEVFPDEDRVDSSQTPTVRFVPEANDEPTLPPLGDEQTEKQFIGDLGDALADEPGAADVGRQEPDGLDETPGMLEDFAAEAGVEEDDATLADEPDPMDVQVPDPERQWPESLQEHPQEERVENQEANADLARDQETGLDRGVESIQSAVPSTVDFSSIWTVGLDMETGPSPGQPAEAPGSGANGVFDAYQDGLSIDPRTVMQNVQAGQVEEAQESLETAAPTADLTASGSAVGAADLSTTPESAPQQEDEDTATLLPEDLPAASVLELQQEIEPAAALDEDTAALLPEDLPAASETELQQEEMDAVAAVPADLSTVPESELQTEQAVPDADASDLPAEGSAEPPELAADNPGAVPPARPAGPWSAIGAMRDFPALADPLADQDEDQDEDRAPAAESDVDQRPEEPADQEIADEEGTDWHVADVLGKEDMTAALDAWSSLVEDAPEESAADAAPEEEIAEGDQPVVLPVDVVESDGQALTGDSPAGDAGVTTADQEAIDEADQAEQGGLANRKHEERTGGLKPSGDNQLIELFREIQRQPQTQDTPATPPVPPVVAAAEEEQRIATVTLAEIYAHQGLTERAIETYRQILALDPENEDIQKKLAGLEQRL